MQFGQGRPPVGVVFDSDMGTGIDDPLALAALYGLAGRGEARVIGLAVTKPNLNAAAFCEVLARFYTGQPGPFASAPPIGLTTHGKHPEETPMIQAVLAHRTAEGQPAFARSIAKMNDTADPVAVIRNALSAQFEKNAIVVLAGPATNLAVLLAMPGIRPFLENKARNLVVALGQYPEGGPDPAIQADLAAAKKLFAEWPTPLIAVGSEVGDAVPFPGASIEKDFAWSPAHPVVEAYKAWREMPYDAPSRALAAILQAVRPQENYFDLSGPGTIAVSDDGRTRFIPSADGRHRYIVVDPSKKDRIVQTYVELASAKPVPRAQRFRPAPRQ